MSRDYDVSRLPNGKYRARIMLNGKRRSNSDCKTRTEAKRWIDQQRTDYARGHWLDPRESRIPIGLYAQEWVTSRAIGWSDNTIRNYRTWLGHIPEPNTPLAEVSSYRIRRWRGIVASEVGIPTANKMLTVLHGVLKSAVQEKRVATNEAEFVEHIPHTPQEKEVLEMDELRALIDNLEGEWQAAARFLAFTGMRSGDGLRVTNRHVDVVNKRVRVDNQKSRKSRGHWVPLMEPIRDDVLHRAKTPGLLFSVTPEDSPDGQHSLDPSNFNRRLKKAAEAAGIDKNVSLHTLRHGLATYALSNGAPMFLVSRWLGHSSIQVTEKHYAHLLADDFEGMVEQIERRWNEGGGLRAVQ